MAGLRQQIAVFYLVAVVRNGNAGQIFVRGLCGCAHRAGIENIGPNVGARIDARNNHVGLAGQQLAQGQFDAVCGRAVNTKALEIELFKFHGPNGLEYGQ